MTGDLFWQGDENFDDDGIQIEPFNLNQEREEGYFDSEGNFVEYVNEKEIKDAWLDSVDLEPKFDKRNMVTKVEDDTQDLTTAAIGKIKRRIADLLEPGETVLQALRRLKGTSNNRKEKMSAETKLLFDQLTEDAMKLLENDVYHEKQEVFEREAEGYERLAQAKGEGTSMGAVQGASGSVMERDLFSVTYLGAAASILPETAAGSSNLNGSTTEISNNDNDAFDMFGEDDEPAPANLSSDGGNLATVPNSDMIDQPLSEVQDTSSESTTIAAVWATIMTHLQDCIALQHLANGVLKKLVYCYYGLCFLMGMELHMMGFKKNRSTTTAVCVCHDGYK
uniref:CD2 antigen cytoplasmic tail-binding protein 2-like n=1 Tax=Vitis vinifera TaxID=29760 RepID=A5B7N9_VITVI|nr:hypothetical protein VITISV_038604 [Vitis vinifera]